MHCEAYSTETFHKWESFMEWSVLVLPFEVHGMYNCIRFETLQNLRLRVSNMLKPIYEIAQVGKCET